MSRNQTLQYIQEQNSSHTIVLWHLQNNPYSCAIKKLFKAIPDLQVATIDIAGNPQTSLLAYELRRLTGERSAPYLFINERFVGGHRAVWRAYRGGYLDTLLRTHVTLRDKDVVRRHSEPISTMRISIENDTWDHKRVSSFVQPSKSLFHTLIPGLCVLHPVGDVTEPLPP